MCKGLSFFHAFTGCDSVSSFYKVGKVKYWTVWSAKIKVGDTNLSSIFIELSNRPSSIDENTFDSLCALVYEAYNLTKEVPLKTRRKDHLISTPTVNLRMLVPSPSGILQHIKRACIQAGYLWKLCELETDIPDPTEWGWKPVPGGSYVPRWQDEAVTYISPIIATCSCSKGDCSKCSWKNFSMKCLIYCKCEDEKCKNK